MDTDPQYKTADGAALRIWRDVSQNKFLSEREGRPLYDEVIFCEVITPGSRDSTPVFELERVFCPEMGHPAPKRGMKYDLYKEYVENFKKGEEHDSSLAGTPLNQWPEMTRTMVATLKAAHIFTLEALAALPDTKITVVGPDGRTWREKAKAYVEHAKSGAYATELAAKVETLHTDLAASLDREKALAARVQELETEAKSGKKASKTSEPAAPVAPNPVAPVAAEGEQLVAAKEPGEALQAII